jgi:hypothetical protein
VVCDDDACDPLRGGVVVRRCCDGRPGESCERDAEPGDGRDHRGAQVAELEFVEEAAE